ncbi:glycosyltransferase family 4 protein [Paracoccus aestuariivivens]|uniref:Glycosyltransferase n=1 Tax=Paracoccus aestuariivivens TaxID=1820333 RepID=A0A6L6J4V0_9RHOB|nr:glycosyltransferase family 4 protein [Paracoccus aestuariivivens]MTH76900.1 glycosyltransferase [Paracoccus aestuariivivens]
MRGDLLEGPNELILLPSLQAQRGPNGGLVLTQKYMEGAAEYAKNWPGPVTSLVALDDQPTTDMDHHEYMPGEGETGLELRLSNTEALVSRLANAAQVVAFLARNELPMLDVCQRMGLPVVFVTEYSPHTERQILASEKLNPLKRLRRHVWLWRTEKIRRKMVARAAGLQCSGTPTYENYRQLNPDTMLFFDNRVRASEVISDQAMEAKLQHIRAKEPLRLVFGGRMIPMKGVMELPRVAAELRRLGVPFVFDVYGSGPQQAELQAKIEAEGLREQMILRGVLDFQTGWIPYLRQSADMFVCCHTQGDPSSTYPEVMSCGVPIAGYANDAFRGIVEVSGSGWQVPIFDAGALARTIARLHENRNEIAASAQKARDFARQHVFEVTFAARAAHFVRTSRLPKGMKPESALAPSEPA